MPSYHALGQWHQVTLLPFDPADDGIALAARVGKAVAGARTARAMTPAATASPNAIAQAVSRSPVLRSRIADPSRLAVVQGAVPTRAINGSRRPRPTTISNPAALTLATETVIA